VRTVHRFGYAFREGLASPFETIRMITGARVPNRWILTGQTRSVDTSRAFATAVGQQRAKSNTKLDAGKFFELPKLARRAGLDLRSTSERLDIAQPARQWLPIGDGLVHQILFGAQRSPCDRGRALPRASRCRSHCPTERALHGRQCSEPALAGLISGATFEPNTPHALTCADSPSIVSSPTRNSERRAMRDDARTVVDVPAAEPTAR
jgi:hypothetical protein